jgi:hypothetical protein
MLDEAGADPLTVTSSAECVTDGPAHASTNEIASGLCQPMNSNRCPCKDASSELDGCELQLSIKPAEMSFGVSSVCC